MNTYATIATISLLFTIMTVSFSVYASFISNNLIIGTIMTFVMFFAIFSFITTQINGLFSLNANNKKKEGLTPMSASAGLYPQSRDKLPLEDIYPANIPFQNGEHTFETMWKEYPAFPAKSMETNLIRYWGNPSNGTCSLPHQCGAFYKKIQPEKAKKPSPPSWGSGIRVNYYDTCSFAKDKEE